MKKVVLIGDSIRLGYDKYIRNALGGVATVCSPEENCRFAQYVLRYAHEWKIAGEWGDDVDVVHWNAGLWDALRLFGEDPFTPLPFYADTLKRVHKRLRLLFPKAKIIFAFIRCLSSYILKKRIATKKTVGSAFFEKKRTNSPVRSAKKVCRGGADDDFFAA